MQTTNVEMWKSVEGFEKYVVSNLGNVKNVVKNNVLSASSIRGGYRSVVIGKKAYKVHRLVAKAFVEKDDDSHDVVNHIDGDKMNNKASNLEWTTIKANNKHAYDTGLNRVTTRAVCKLDENDNILETFESLREAKEETGISDGNIASVCKNGKKAGGFRWKFRDVNKNEGEIDTTGFIPVNGFPNYLISSEGVVYNPRYKKILKQQINSDGYKTISLVNNNSKKSFLVHRLVATHFVDKVDGKDLVNHKDSNKLNCNADNLEWCNNSENVKHAIQNKKNNQKKSDS